MRYDLASLLGKKQLHKATAAGIVIITLLSLLFFTIAVPSAKATGGSVEEWEETVVISRVFIGSPGWRQYKTSPVTWQAFEEKTYEVTYQTQKWKGYWQSRTIGFTFNDKGELVPSISYTWVRDPVGPPYTFKRTEIKVKEACGWEWYDSDWTEKTWAARMSIGGNTWPNDQLFGMNLSTDKPPGGVSAQVYLDDQLLPDGYEVYLQTVPLGYHNLTSVFYYANGTVTRDYQDISVINCISLTVHDNTHIVDRSWSYTTYYVEVTNNDWHNATIFLQNSAEPPDLVFLKPQDLYLDPQQSTISELWLFDNSTAPHMAIVNVTGTVYDPYRSYITDPAPSYTTGITPVNFAVPCDGLGNPNMFTTIEDAFIRGVAFPAEANIDVYVIPDGLSPTLNNAVAHLSVVTDSNGTFPPTKLPHISPGAYDLWSDVNRNGLYDSGDGMWHPLDNVYAMEIQSSVGGIVIPVDKFGLLTRYVGLASTILVATAATGIYVKRVKHGEEKQ